MRAAPRPLALLALLALGGCANPPTTADERVVLLPGADGVTGVVVVERAGETLTLDTPYAAASSGAGGAALRAGTADPEATRHRFAHALAALPVAPATFIVHFLFAQDELTEESRRAIVPVLNEVATRPAPDVTVIGHADQVGAERINEALALRRAERVRELLVGRGVPAENIVVIGRGSREPLVRGGDGAAEARNRRVEITVR